MQEFVTRAAFINFEDLEYFLHSFLEKLLKCISNVVLPITKRLTHFKSILNWTIRKKYCIIFSEEIHLVNLLKPIKLKPSRIHLIIINDFSMIIS